MRCAAATTYVFLSLLLLEPARAQPFILVEDGESRALIYAPGENQRAGHRLAERLRDLTGAQVRLETGSAAPEGAENLVAIGTPESNALVREAMKQDPRAGGLAEEGYLLKLVRSNGRRILFAAGQTSAGANNAVSELLSWKMRVTE